MMTEEEFIEKANLSRHQVRTWLESGLLEAKRVNGPARSSTPASLSERDS
jgi:hypothetical protein